MRTPIIVGLLCVLISGCGGQPVPTLSPAQQSQATQTLVRAQTKTVLNVTATAQSIHLAIRATFSENLEATNTKDLQRYMKTIHPDSPAYGSTQTLFQQLFSQVDFHADVVIDEITLSSLTEARVKFRLTTKKVSGTNPFRDNVVTGVFTMRPDGDSWKIYSQEVTNIQYLN